MKKEHVLITLLCAALVGFFLGRLSIEVHTENVTASENLPNTARQPALRDAANREKAQRLAAKADREKAKKTIQPQRDRSSGGSSYSSNRGEEAPGLRFAAYKGAPNPKVVIIESSDFQ